MVLNWERTEIYASVASLTAVAGIFVGGLLFESRPYHRIFLSSAAIALSSAGIILVNCKGKNAQWEGKLALNSMREAKATIEEGYLERIYKLAHPRAAREWQEAEIVEEQPAIAPGESEYPYYQLANLIDDASGIIVAGGTGYGKSSVAKWILWLLTQSAPAVFRLFDGHGIENNWEDLGLQAVTKFSAIETGLIEAETELDLRREDKSRRTPWLVVCDELGASFDNFEDPKRIQKILRRLGSEGRKFGVTAILINQSDNCSALGIDSKYRANFTTIFLGEIARAAFKKGTEERELLDATAYPCCVGGNIPLKPAKHPTHGDYATFKKKGNAPKNLQQPNQIKGEIEGETESDRNQQQQSQQSKATDKINLDKTPEPPTAITLEAIYSQDEDLPATVFSEAEWELLGLAGETGSITVRDAQNSNLARREEWDSDKIKSLFSRFAELGLGSIHHGARDTVEFRVNGGQGND